MARSWAGGKAGHVLSIANAAWQSGPAALRPSQLPGVRTAAFTAFYSPRYLPALVYVPWVSADVTHVKQPQHLQKLAERPREGLWWQVFTPVAVGAKKVLRVAAARRMKRAWREAMEGEGFGGDGRGHEVGKKLVGSLRFVAKEGFWRLESKVLGEEMRIVVKALCKECGVTSKRVVRGVGLAKGGKGPVRGKETEAEAAQRRRRLRDMERVGGLSGG